MNLEIYFNLIHISDNVDEVVLYINISSALRVIYIHISVLKLAPS